MSKMSKKILGLGLILVFMLGVLAACAGGNSTTTNGSTPADAQKQSEASKQSEAPKTELSGTVTASGSSALLPMVQLAAKEFMEKNPKVTVNVTGGGSGTGLKQVAAGEVNIGNSDVAAGDEYKDKGLVDHVVSIAPFAIITNPGVGVENLTKQQAADIFTGKITNWKDVGGKDLKITVVHRPDSSGSRKLVSQIVLEGKDFTKEGVTQAESKAMKTAVAETAGAIGYVDTPYIDNTVKAVQFDGVSYSKETIKAGTYKLYGIEHMYTKGEATGAVKAFLDYIMSKDFQSTQVEKLGFLQADLLKK
ncbi:phosphate ABC transporter substrate-binding protein [Paenibacillus sp. y28]|uniref:phosphate ABC transporter substrate-binding protein n=1 Tax=Paenibacillus sp. y28 TaxID=3129110 RepID=UPI00301ACD4F